MAELVHLHLREVDLELLADLQNLPNDAVRQFQHLLTKSSVGALLTIATNEQRCELETHADCSRAVVAIMLASI